VDALDRGRVHRVAGESVEPVGGEDRYSALADCLLELGSRGVGAISFDFYDPSHRPHAVTYGR
jgi:hypothetical protein